MAREAVFPDRIHLNFHLLQSCVKLNYVIYHQIETRRRWSLEFGGPLEKQNVRASAKLQNRHSLALHYFSQAQITVKSCGLPYVARFRGDVGNSYGRFVARFHRFPLEISTTKVLTHNLGPLWENATCFLPATERGGRGKPTGRPASRVQFPPAAPPCWASASAWDVA